MNYVYECSQCYERDVRPARTLAWHFLPDDGMTADYGKRRTKVGPGTILRVAGPVKCCEDGLHGAERLIDALKYAPGSLLERTRHSGEIDRQDDKICSTIRETLWMLDAEWYLHEFACRAAEKAIEWSGAEPDPRSVAAIECKRAWLAGSADDEDLAAARDAGWSAASSAAWSADWSAASSAAWSAAWSAASSAAWSAAWFAASSAARDASRDASRYAAWDAASSAASSAARYAASSELNAILT